MDVLELMEEAAERAASVGARPGDVVLSLRGEGEAIDYTLKEVLERIAVAHLAAAHGDAGIVPDEDWEPVELPDVGPSVTVGSLLATVGAVVLGTTAELARRARVRMLAGL